MQSSQISPRSTGISYKKQPVMRNGSKLPSSEVLDAEHAWLNPNKPLVKQMRADGVDVCGSAFLAGQMHAMNRAETLKQFYLDGDMASWERLYTTREKN